MIETFINHSNKVNILINSSDLSSIKESKNIIIDAILNRKNIYVAGNGGSFAIADHFICDFAKRVSEKAFLPVRIYHLSIHSSLMSAVSNDLAYDQSYSYQAERYLEKNDVVILISSSGSSNNILNAFEVAKRKNCKIISLYGFNIDSKLKGSDSYLYINSNSYEEVEDCHHIFMHSLSLSIQNYFQKNK